MSSEARASILQAVDGSTHELKGSRVTVVNRQEHGRRTAAAGAWVSDGPFDLCICELEPDYLVRFRDIFELIRPQMRAGGRIVVVCINSKLRGDFLNAAQMIRSAFPLVGRSEIRYSGTAEPRQC